MLYLYKKLKLLNICNFNYIYSNIIIKMASSVNIISTTTTGRVNNTPITKCIHCRDKTPNSGFPFCNDCYKLRSASQQACSKCNNTMISRIPYSKLVRMYCTMCTEEYKVKKQDKQVKIAIPASKPSKPSFEFHETTHAKEEKQRLLEMFEGMSHLQIVNIVYDMLEEKEQFIQATLNDNDLLKFQVETLSE